MSRRRARERALQAMYQLEIAENPVEKALENTFVMARLSPQAQGYTEKIVRGAWECQEAIDQYIQKYASRWEVERLTTVDRNILRLAIYEMLHEDEIPLDVSINEAIEVAKKYSSHRASTFINGILDSVKKDFPAGGEGK
ncbi:MAG: transcription antitermination factor NusB [Clostridia bacterium]|nr:transcription antitermination factor NusB [Clostridia bacterium]